MPPTIPHSRINNWPIGTPASVTWTEIGDKSYLKNRPIGKLISDKKSGLTHYAYQEIDNTTVIPILTAN